MFPAVEEFGVMFLLPILAFLLAKHAWIESISAKPVLNSTIYKAKHACNVILFVKVALGLAVRIVRNAGMTPEIN